MDRIQQTIENLEKNNMSGYFVRDKKELIDLISDLIPDGSTVGCGDSVTAVIHHHYILNNPLNPLAL
jgi:hypothetical protein